MFQCSEVAVLEEKAETVILRQATQHTHDVLARLSKTLQDLMGDPLIPVIRFTIPKTKSLQNEYRGLLIGSLRMS